MLVLYLYSLLTIISSASLAQNSNAGNYVGSLEEENQIMRLNNGFQARQSAPGASARPASVGGGRHRTKAAKRGANSTDMIVHEREFNSPQVRVQMDCQRDRTIIKVNFTQPFNGILGAGKLETSNCSQMGNGTKNYVLQVAHNETQCDTQWDSANSSIFNTLFIRFHSSLETGSDIAKNIMCRLTVGDLVVGRRNPKNQKLRGGSGAPATVV